jgi:lipopolysaccharide export LptBFGC system permease protein LptF
LRLLDRYLLRQIWAPMLIASVAIGFIVIAGAVQGQIKLIQDKVPIVTISLGDISWISLYALPTLIGYILPITLLLGIMLTFSRMAQNNELTAMKAAGIPLKRVALPVIVLGAALSGLCFLIQDQAQPWAYRQMKWLVGSDLPLRITLDVLPKGVMHHYGDWRVYIGEKTADGMLQDIMVMQPHPDGTATAFYAKSAGLQREGNQSKLIMHRGLYIRPSKEDEQVTRVPFERLEKTAPRLDSVDDRRSRQELTLRELIQSERLLSDEFERTGALPVAGELRDYRLEINGRLAFPLMCLAVCFVAAPIGARTRRAGRSFTFASGLIIVASYFVLRKLVEPSWLPSLSTALLLGQIPNVLLSAAGIFFVWRVDRV